jgi:hypothetical protein
VVRDYASWVRQACKGQAAAELSASLQTAMQLYEALGVTGVTYQGDPTVPFAWLQARKQAVDTISLPRETLARGAGDCDDLTVLMCSLLESVGVESGFITVPGRIYVAVNTKVKARDYGSLHPEQAMTIALNDELWVPVDVTSIGKATFMEAWTAGAGEWSAWDGDPGNRALYVVREAQEVYRSVALKEAEASFRYGDQDRVAEAFRENLRKLADLLTAPLAAAADDSGPGRRSSVGRGTGSP